MTNAELNFFTQVPQSLEHIAKILAELKIEIAKLNENLNKEK